MTIGILTWGAPKTLRNTLRSYSLFGLNRIREEKIILIQEPSAEDWAIAQEFGWRPIFDGNLKENIGIARGYKALVEAAQEETFLFLENDWELVEDASAAINDSRFLLSTGMADIVRLRHRQNPGHPLWTRQFEGHEEDRLTHLLDSVHWREDPSMFEQIQRFENYGREWFITTARYANWTNNPHYAYTSFLKENVLPYIGTGNLEGALQGWWEQQDFKVAQGQGLFTHNRLD